MQSGRDQQRHRQHKKNSNVGRDDALSEYRADGHQPRHSHKNQREGVKMLHGCIEHLTQRQLSQWIDKDSIEKGFHTTMFLKIGMGLSGLNRRTSAFGNSSQKCKKPFTIQTVFPG